MTILQTMRSLDLFSEQSIGRYYSIAIRNKLAAILEPAAAIEVRKPRAVKAPRRKRQTKQAALRMAA